MQILQTLLKIIDTWISAHPNLVVGLILFEAADSGIASYLPMPQNGSTVYKVIFAFMHGLALNPARIGAAVRMWRNPGGTQEQPTKAA
jgi:hypothetical protein